MRFLKWLVLLMLVLTVAGNICLFVLAFQYQWIPDAMAYGFSLAVPVELAISGLMRIMEDKYGNKLPDAQQDVYQPNRNRAEVRSRAFDGGWDDQSDDVV